MKNVPLARIILIPLGLTAGSSATDAVIPKKIYKSVMFILIISNQEIRDWVLLKDWVY